MASMSKQVTFEFELGEQVRDKITLSEGVAIARHDHITGCKQYTIQPQGVDKDGKVKESYYFDESRLERVKKKAVDVNVPAARPGGPRGRVSTPRPRSTR